MRALQHLIRVRLSNKLVFSEQFEQYAKKTADFSGLFDVSKEESSKIRNGSICPNEYNKKEN